MSYLFGRTVGPKDQPDMETGPCCTWEKPCNCSGEGSAGSESVKAKAAKKPVVKSSKKK